VAEEDLLADAELADDLGHRIARLSLPERERDLLFRKVPISHLKNPLFLVTPREKNLPFRMDQETGRTSPRWGSTRPRRIASGARGSRGGGDRAAETALALHPPQDSVTLKP
jgi:hypothetical protein